MGSKAGGAIWQRMGPSVSAQNCVQDETPEVPVSPEAVRVVTQCLPCFLCASPESLFLTTLGTWSQVRLCSLVRQLCSSVMLLKFMTDIFIFIFSTSSITVSSGRPRCINVFVPHSSSQWQRSSPFPTHKGIVDSGRVCWLFMGQQSLCE